MKIQVLLQRNPFVETSAQNNRFLSLAEGLVANKVNMKLLFVEFCGLKSEKLKFSKSGNYKGFEYEYLSPVVTLNPIIKKLGKVYYNSKVLANKIYNQYVNDNYDYLWLGVSEEIFEIASHLILFNSEINLFHERSEFSWIAFPNNKKLHDDYLKNILPRIKVMAVMTKKLNEYYNQFLSKQTALIHLPMTVDLSRFSEKQAEASLSGPYIGYCGSMNNSKDGVDILIQAFIEIMDQFPDLHLYLAGAKDPREDYSAQVKLIEKNNAQSRITYLGQLSREEIPAFLSNASILALARPNSQQSEGGFPTKLGEYLASGRPVCVTDIGEISDYLVNDKSAFFAEPGSFISFSQAITKALSAADIEKVGKEGQKIAFQIFNKDIQSKRLYDFLVSNK